MVKLAGPLLVITGPSAVGKNTVVRQLVKDHKQFGRVVTYTTRKPRKGERQGKDYNFVSKAIFQKKIKDGSFVDHVEFNRHLYGTALGSFEDLWGKSKLPVLLAEVKGATKWHKKGAYVIFIAPGKIEDLISLIEARGEKKALTDLRIKTALRELKSQDKYDRKVINRLGQLDATVALVAKLGEKLLDKQRRSLR